MARSPYRNLDGSWHVNDDLAARFRTAPRVHPRAVCDLAWLQTEAQAEDAARTIATPTIPACFDPKPEWITGQFDILDEFGWTGANLDRLVSLAREDLTFRLLLWVIQDAADLEYALTFWDMPTPVQDEIEIERDRDLLPASAFPYFPTGE